MGYSGRYLKVGEKSKAKIRRDLQSKSIRVSNPNAYMYDSHLYLEMLAVLELIGLYSDINQEIIDKRLHSTTRYFVAVTKEL